jgi:hypothetical protein
MAAVVATLVEAVAASMEAEAASTAEAAATRVVTHSRVATATVKAVPSVEAVRVLVVKVPVLLAAGAKASAGPGA